MFRSSCRQTVCMWALRTHKPIRRVHVGSVLTKSSLTMPVHDVFEELNRSEFMVQFSRIKCVCSTLIRAGMLYTFYLEFIRL